MFEIKTANDTEWVVLAEWYGATRVVFTGTLFECIRWTA